MHFSAISAYSAVKSLVPRASMPSRVAKIVSPLAQAADTLNNEYLQ